MSDASLKYKVGDIVKVYEDPITKTKFEGEAEIVFVGERDNYYQVKFTGEDVAVWRTIHIKHQKALADFTCPDCGASVEDMNITGKTNRPDNEHIQEYYNCKCGNLIVELFELVSVSISD